MKHEKGAYFLAGDFWFCIDLGEPVSNPLPGYTHFAFSIEQKYFKAISEKIKSSGAKIWKSNESEGDSLYFVDPDGYRFEIHVGDWKTRLNHYKNTKPEGKIFYEV